MQVAAALQPVALSTGLTETELKHYFGVCEKNANTLMLDDADGANFSIVYEDLKRRVFGGDTAALFDWWQKEKP